MIRLLLTLLFSNILVLNVISQTKVDSEIKDFSVLIDEHNLVQKLKENGYSYADIQALIKEKKEKKNDDEIF